MMDMDTTFTTVPMDIMNIQSIKDHHQPAVQEELAELLLQSYLEFAAADASSPLCSRNRVEGKKKREAIDLRKELRNKKLLLLKR